MPKKKKSNKDFIAFTGEAANGVTGSQYLVSFDGLKVLIECGLYQSSKNSYLDSYKINSRKFDFNPADIDFVFVCHAHIDHCGLIPRLVKEGFRGEIIATEETAKIIKHLLLNSSYILKDEARVLSKRFAREYAPIYNEEDVYASLKLVHSYSEYNKLYQVDDRLKFQWLTNAHCVGAAQLQLILSNDKKIKKILYTSDIGPLNCANHYVSKTFIPEFFNDYVIMESTYGSSTRGRRKARKFDNEHLKSAILTTIDKKGKVIAPAFSFARTQEILTTLYRLFGNDDEFKTPVIVDSMLSADLCRLYPQLLKNEDAQLWDKIMNWENLTLIKRKDVSMANLKIKDSQIVITSSGFCTNGRVVDYLRENIKDPNSTICFSGYVGNNPSYLAYRIKNSDDQSYITINHKRIKNKANCICMSSYSSHADHNDLVEYASSLRTNQIILVHGEKDAQHELKEAILKANSKKDKAIKVSASYIGMVIKL